MAVADAESGWWRPPVARLLPHPSIVSHAIGDDTAEQVGHSLIGCADPRGAFCSRFMHG